MGGTGSQGGTTGAAGDPHGRLQPLHDRLAGHPVATHRQTVVTDGPLCGVWHDATRLGARAPTAWPPWTTLRWPKTTTLNGWKVVR